MCIYNWYHILTLLTQAVIAFLIVIHHWLRCSQYPELIGGNNRYLERGNMMHVSTWQYQSGDVFFFIKKSLCINVFVSDGVEAYNCRKNWAKLRADDDWGSLHGHTLSTNPFHSRGEMIICRAISVVKMDTKCTYIDFSKKKSSWLSLIPGFIPLAQITNLEK